MQYEYFCDECGEAVAPATTRAELAWLKDRMHVVREVAGHVHGGLDTWIVEGLDFLNRHGQHDVVLRRKA